MQFATKLGASLLLALATAASPAFARDGWRDHDGDDRGRGYYDSDRHDHGRHDRGRHDDRRWDGRRWDDRRAPSYGYYDGRYDGRRGPPPRWNGPGYGNGYYVPAPRWTRGARYYDRGYGPTYVIRDYRAYGLRYPPRGYGWRRDDRGDFLLVALATGIIADLVIHGGY